MSNVPHAERFTSIFFSILKFIEWKICDISIQFSLPNSILVCHLNFLSFDRQP